MAYEIHLLYSPPQQSRAVVRRLATRQQLSRVIPEACGQVGNALGAQQIKGASRHVAVFPSLVRTDVFYLLAADQPVRG